MKELARFCSIGVVNVYRLGKVLKQCTSLVSSQTPPIHEEKRSGDEFFWASACSYDWVMFKLFCFLTHSKKVWIAE